VSEPIPQSGPETWLAARLAKGLPAETWKPMARIGRCTFSGYEVSDTGSARSLSRTGRNGRPLDGGPVSTRRSSSGYLQLDMRCDSEACKGAHTFTVQKAVLWTFDKPRPRGMDASHLYGNPEHNWYPEGLAWEDKPTNEGRKIDRPPPPDPAHPCRNAAAGCENKVLNEGRRCEPCCADAGRDIAAMLRAGARLSEAAEKYEYTSLAWPLQLAAKYGGYTGTMADAMNLRPAPKGWRKVAAKLLKVGLCQRSQSVSTGGGRWGTPLGDLSRDLSQRVTTVTAGSRKTLARLRRGVPGAPNWYPPGVCGGRCP